MPILVAFPFLRPPLKEVCLKAASTDSLKFCAVPIKLAAQSNISTRVRPRVALQDGVRGGGGGYGRGLRLWQAQVRLAWNELQILLAPFQGAQEKEEGNETSGSKRRCLTAKGQPGVAKGMGMVGSCCNLNAYVSFLGALESSVRPSVCSSSRVEFGILSGRGAGRGRVNLAAASSKYLCLCFIYLHCQNQFCPRVQLFFTFMPRPLPTYLAM